MRYVHSVVAATLFCLAIAVTGRADEPRAGQVISLDLLVADVAGAALGEGEVTAAKVLELASQGKVDAAARITTTVLENTPAVVSFTETVPVATARQDIGGGFGGTVGARALVIPIRCRTTVRRSRRRPASSRTARSFSNCRPSARGW